MVIPAKGKFLSFDERKTKDKRVFYISKCFVEGADEIADIFSNDEPVYSRDDIVDLNIKLDLTGRKVSVNFA